jgi:hypothetical protein
MNQINTESEIAARRRTFDGVQIFVHADGSLSNRTNFIGRSKLPISMIWIVADEICTYTHDELAGLIRSVKSGAWEQAREKTRSRLAWIASGNAEAQVETNRRDRMAAAREFIEYNRNPWKR